MVAVSSSAVDPLPHQIKAVYGELLPRTPLRFLLADDPGAGKTIMAGLYAKELMLRGDLNRMLIIAPGSLVEQWQDELAASSASPPNCYRGDDHQPRRQQPVHPLPDPDRPHGPAGPSDDPLALLDASDWDLIVVDEAHRMSANYYGGELDTTRRYQLGQRLGEITRHLLLMTATPHAGSEVQLPGVHGPTRPGPLRRRIPLRRPHHRHHGADAPHGQKELLTFEGKPLFPERIAETVPYQLSDGEKHLYDRSHRYVREGR